MTVWQIYLGSGIPKLQRTPGVGEPSRMRVMFTCGRHEEKNNPAVRDDWCRLVPFFPWSANPVIRALNISRGLRCRGQINNQNGLCAFISANSKGYIEINDMDFPEDLAQVCGQHRQPHCVMLTLHLHA